MSKTIEDLLDEELNNFDPTKSTSDTNADIARHNETKDDAKNLVYEPYEPPESLWQLIKSVANQNELDVIKSIVGDSLIETSLDLHNEIDTLLEIWRDYRNETLTNLNQIKQSINNKTNLPEPPNIRETIKKEIKFFVKQMRELYKEDDKFCKQIVTNNHNLNVINYVLNAESSSSEEIYQIDRASKSLSRMTTTMAKRSSSMTVPRPPSVYNKNLGNETPLISTNLSTGRQSRQRVRYRPISRSSSLSSSRPVTSMSSNQDVLYGESSTNNKLDENLELIVDEEKINCMQIDEIADHLRELFEKENEALKSDVEFLYECIYKESDYRFESRQGLCEPSLHELKEERKRLETNLLSSTGKNQIIISKLPTSVSHNTNNRSINSPVFSSNRMMQSPPGSASSNSSSTRSALKSNTPNSSSIAMKTTQNLAIKRASSLVRANNTKVTNEIASIKQQMKKQIIKTPNELSRLTTSSRENSDIKKNLHHSAQAPPPLLLARTNSVSSIASSVDSNVSSSMNSSSSRLTAVQKFRQMVMDSRDD